MGNNYAYGTLLLITGIGFAAVTIFTLMVLWPLLSYSWNYWFGS